jgi:hypothetical protein
MSTRDLRANRRSGRTTGRACHQAWSRHTQWLVFKQSPSRFDRQQHDAFAKRRGQKTVPSIEADGVIIDRVCNDRSRAGDL